MPGWAAKADERNKLERLCRSMSRPAISEKRLSLTPNGNVRYQLKTPYRVGTTHVIFEPLDFIARLAALVAKPRVNLTPLHGVFAPNSRYRGAGDEGHAGQGRPASRDWGSGGAHTGRTPGIDDLGAAPEALFHIDVEICRDCGGAVRIIACIEESVVIEKILTHLDKKNTPQGTGLFPEGRAPPAGLFG